MAKASTLSARDFVRERLRITAKLIGESVELSDALKEFFDQQAYGVFLLSMRGEVTFANDYASSVSHAHTASSGWDPYPAYTSAEALKPLPSASLPALRALYGTETEYTRVRFVQRDTGDAVLMHLAATPVRSSLGVVVGALSITFADSDGPRDLRWASREAVLQLIDNSPIAIAVLDRDLTCVACSASWRAMHNLEGTDQHGRRLEDMSVDLDDDDRGIVLRALAGETVEGRTRTRRLAGERDQHIQWKYAPWTDRFGEVAGVTLQRGFVTEQVEAELLLVETNRQLARSNTALEQFAYAASHDLLEPLRMVSQFSELLKTRYHDAIDERGQRYIGFMSDGAVRMQQMVADLMRYARAGDACEIEPVSLRTVFMRAVENVRAAVVAENAIVSWDGAPEVLGVEGVLVSVFQNLLANAVKFRSERPPIIKLTAREVGEFIEVEVRDNGRGFDPEQTANLFRLFRRADPNAQRAGSGIGLALVQRSVESLGGSVRAEGRPGEGASFFVSLKAAKNARGQIFPET